jgi:hypothetical protein
VNVITYSLFPSAFVCVAGPCRNLKRRAVTAREGEIFFSGSDSFCNSRRVFLLEEVKTNPFNPEGKIQYEN